MKSHQKNPIYTPFANNTNNDINGMTDAVTATLIKHVENGRNVALISPRRLGKSGLIEHLFQQPAILKSYYTFYIDIYSTRSASELVYAWSKELYQSAITMGLSPIPEDTYVQFATHLFELFDKRVSPDVIRTVYREFEGVTWFVQMLMNELFSLTPHGTTCEMPQVDVALENIVMSQEAQYKELMSLIPPKQKQVLQAIAREGRASNVTSAQFIRKYQLPSASSIQSAIKGLTEKEILTQENGCYRIYDYFLAYWIARVY